MRQLGTSDLNRLKSHVVYFRGGHPCDDGEVYTLKPPYSVIINTDNHNKPGQHWVGVYIDSERMFFADSFGRSVWDESFPVDFRKTLKRLSLGRRLIYNPKLVQSLTSNACGYHCMYVLDRLSLNKSIREIYRVFDDDLTANDSFVVKYYNLNFVDK